MRAHTPERVSGTEVARRIAKLLHSTAAIISFDADGTLWSGDVGVDVFRAAVLEQRILPEARPVLQRYAQAHELPVVGDPSQLAGSLFDGYLNGQVPELATCEIMTLCYAGWQERELVEYAAKILKREGLEHRLRDELFPTLQVARERGAITLVVSASPAPILAAAASAWSFAAPCLLAAKAKVTAAGRLQDELEAPVPYGLGKPAIVRQHFPSAEWLAAFGDSAFDIEMLREARLPVAVYPKPALWRRLRELPDAVVLGDAGQLEFLG